MSWTASREASTMSAAVLLLRLAWRAQPLDALQRCRHVGDAVGVGDDLDGVGVVGQPVLGEQLLSLDGVELLGVGLLGRQPGGVEPEQAQAGEQQQAGGGHPDPSRTVADRAPDPGPQAVGSGLGAAEAGALGPEDPTAADHQQRGQQRDHHQHGDGDTDGDDRAEAGGGVELGEGQAQHADRHCRGACEDGGRSAVQGERHRLVAVLVAAQLFSVAGHEQQGIVRPRSDDQDAQDRLALAVDGESGVLRQQVDQAGGDGVGDDGADDR
jgi:hypothetical protein